MVWMTFSWATISTAQNPTADSLMIEMGSIEGDGARIDLMNKIIYEVPTLTQDQRTLIVRTTGAGGRDIWRVPLDSGQAMVPLLTSPADEVAPALSPDGRWLAYMSTESTRNEVYVRSYPGMGARYQI